MPSYTIFKHQTGRSTPSFEIVERATAAEARAYGVALLQANTDYDRLEIVHADSGFDEVLERAAVGAAVD